MPGIEQRRIITERQSVQRDGEKRVSYYFETQDYKKIKNTASGADFIKKMETATDAGARWTYRQSTGNGNLVRKRKEEGRISTVMYPCSFRFLTDYLLT